MSFLKYEKPISIDLISIDLTHSHPVSIGGWLMFASHPWHLINAYSSFCHFFSFLNTAKQHTTKQAREGRHIGTNRQIGQATSTTWNQR